MSVRAEGFGARTPAPLEGVECHGGTRPGGRSPLPETTLKIDGFLQASLSRSRGVRGAALAYIHMTRTQDHTTCV